MSSGLPLWPAGVAVAALVFLGRSPAASDRLATLRGVRVRAGAGRTWWPGVAGHWLRQRSRGSAGSEGRRCALVFVDALAADLSVGQPPVLALQRAAAESGDAEIQRAGRAAVFGADAASDLRDLATRPGWASLGAVAACWSVGIGSGAGLADGLRRVAVVVRTQHEAEREVAAALAAPRATARMLAVLPLVGLGLGALLGARPWQVLFGTPYGLACLMVGLLLDAAGVLWVERMARSARPADVSS